jgi:23S rRNA pseudouridine1911/1915/1917 synthase
VRHPGDRFAPEESERPAGRAARTDFRVLERWRNHSLLEVRIATGRTHQIRVHLAAVGHPVAGDRLYGAAAMDLGPPETQLQGAREPELHAGEPPSRRFFLHARRIRLAHPSSHEPLSIEAPLPPDFEKLVRSLRV